MRAVVIRNPWRLDYGVIMGGDSHHAIGVGSDGNVVYSETGQSEQVPPFLRLRPEEMEALARAILAEERPEDATIDALKDARSTRDRLLAMLEQRGIR